MCQLNNFLERALCDTVSVLMLKVPNATQPIQALPADPSPFTLRVSAVAADNPQTVNSM